jgi:hypothetical protein
VRDDRAVRIFGLLHLLSFGVFAGWFVLLLIGLAQPGIMALANRIALPTLLGSIICLELFKRLGRRAENRLLANGSRD